MDTPQEKGKKGGTTKWFLLLLLLAASVVGNIIQLAQKLSPTTPPLPLPSPTAKPAPDPAAEYLTAAQAAKEASKPEEAMALYEAALARSKDKTAILTEMTALTKEQIEQDLKAEDAAAGRERAQKRLARLEAVCEAAVAAGSVADITGKPALEQQLSELANLIPSEPQVVEEPAPAPDPAAEYLAAAKAATDPDVAMALYEAALAHSADKLSVLDQMTKWTEEQIKKELQNQDAAVGRASAQKCFTHLVIAYERGVAAGSVADINRIPELNERLEEVSSLITSKDNETATLEDPETVLADVRTKLEELGKNENRTFAEVQELVEELEATDWDPSMVEKKNELLTEVVNCSFSLPSPPEALKVPEVNDVSLWAAWLERFAKRLENEPSTDQRFLDWGTATVFIEAAKMQRKNPAIASSLENVEKAHRCLIVDYWSERTKEALSQNEWSDDKARVAMFSSLLAESEIFSDSEKYKCKNQIISLNKRVLKFTLTELGQAKSRAIGVENQVPTNVYIQMLGTLESQYLQLLTRIQELASRSSNQFLVEKGKVTNQLKDLEERLDIARRLTVAEAESKLEKQKERYRYWANVRLAAAKRLYDEAEKEADKNKQGAQTKYGKAWWEIMPIHPDDIYVVSPALRQYYDSLKGKIESKIGYELTREKHYDKIQYGRLKDATLP